MNVETRTRQTRAASHSGSTGIFSLVVPSAGVVALVGVVQAPMPSLPLTSPQAAPEQVGKWSLMSAQVCHVGEGTPSPGFCQ